MSLVSKHPPIDPAYINERLQVLVGLPLTYMWRPIGQAFEFGEQIDYVDHDGEERTDGEYELKLLDVWRVSVGPYVVMGSDDHEGKRRFYDRQKPPRSDSTQPLDPLVRWQRARDFLDLVELGTLRVTSVDFDDGCVLRVSLSEGYSIAGMSSGSLRDHIFFMTFRSPKGRASILVTENIMVEGSDAEDEAKFGPRSRTAAPRPSLGASVRASSGRPPE